MMEVMRMDPSMMAVRAGGMPVPMPMMGGRARGTHPAIIGMPAPHPAMAMGRGAMGMGISMGRPAVAMVGMPTPRRHHYAGLMGGGNVSGMDSRLATFLAMCAGGYPGMDMYSSGHSRRGRRCYDDLDFEFERDPYFMFDESWWDTYDEEDDECDDPILIYGRDMRRLKRGRGRYGRRGPRRLCYDDLFL